MFGYEYINIFFPVPKGTWISVEVIVERPFAQVISSLKLNNHLVYSNVDEFDFLKSLEPVELFGEFCHDYLGNVCVEGFYRNLQIDFGTCGEPG